MSIFDSISLRKPKYTTFDLSFQNKFTCGIGREYPFFCKEVIPGDTFKVDTSSLIRFDALIAPVMQDIDVYMHYFFVPNRLLMPEKDWEAFITGGRDGKEVRQLPYFTPSDMSNLMDGDFEGNYFSPTTLADFLNYPVSQYYGETVPHVNNNIDNSASTQKMLSFPLRACQLIHQEYYRDQNFEDPYFDFQTASVNEAENGLEWCERLFNMNLRCYKKDYFTSALPWLQRGTAASVGVTVDTNMSSVDTNSQKLEFLLPNIGWTSSKSDLYDYIRDHNYPIPSNYQFDVITQELNIGEVGQCIKVVDPDEPDVDYITIPIRDVEGMHNHELTVNTSTITINELRRTEALQAWLERNMRAGARYIEQIISHFGVVPDDARLQRPEYLGGGHQPVLVSEVLQTSSTDATSPQGNQSGHAISQGRTFDFKRKFKEHGWIIGIMTIIPRSSYSQGLPKSLTRFDKFDYAFPEFGHLGEQPILNREIYYNDNDSTTKPNDVFGYQSIYADYKFSLDEVHGLMKTSNAYYHLGRIFNNEPALGEDFLSVKPTDNDRIFATTGEAYKDQITVMLYNKVLAKRALPKYGTPLMSI